MVILNYKVSAIGYSLIGDDGQTSDPEEKEVEDQPLIEEVALVVPVTDDPTFPVFTVMCSAHVFEHLQNTALSHICYFSPDFGLAVLPTRKMKIFEFEYSLNLGPFNMKEHVLITIFASNAVSSWGGDAYSIGAITVMKAYYKQNVSSHHRNLITDLDL